MTALGADSASLLHFVPAMNTTAATAGGSGDGDAVNGTGINTVGYSARFNSATFAVRANATLAEDKTLSLPVKIQDSADNSDFADVAGATETLLLTGGTGGTTEAGVAVVGVDLRRCRQYVRVVATPQLNATGTDTSSISAICVLAGADELPII